MKVRTLVMAAGLVLALSGAVAAQETNQEFDTALAILLHESQDEPCTNKETLREFLDDPRYEQSHTILQQGTLAILGLCAENENRYEDVYVLLDQLSNVTQIDRMTIVSQIELAIEFDYNDDLPALLLNWTQAPQISGANLSMDAANRRQSAIRNAISRIKNTSNSPEQELVVLEALRADGYSYVTTFMVPDYTRMRHAELAADRGDFETVELLFKEVQHPQFMMNAQLNKVFSEVVNTPEFEHWRDIRARYEDWGQFWMEKSKNNPERLEPIYNLIGAYARLGQNAKAKNVILSVLAEIDAGESSYTDQYRYENWFRDDYATLLYREGQVEEAFIQMRRGIGAGENGGANVSQVLNLALAQCQSGDPQKALTTLQIASPDRMSDYGRMVRSSIEVCIYSQLGDEAKVEHAIEYLETNSLDSWENLLTAYLFADRQPSAIKLLSEKLRSEKERSNALWHVQILEGDNDNYQSEFQELIETRKQAVIADPRVQSAIKQAGLRKRWPIASLY